MTAPTITAFRAAHAETLLRLSQHGYDAVGEPRLRGGAVVVDFRQYQEEPFPIAEEEMGIWLAQLDALAARRPLVQLALW